MKIQKLIIVILTAGFVLTGLASCGRKQVRSMRSTGEKQVVMVEELKLSDLNEYITVSGKLEGSNDVLMVSETTGRILKLYKKLGDRIAKGERIGSTDNDVYRIQLDQAEAAKLAAESSFENARLNLAASENLYQKTSISAAEYNAAKAAFKAAKAGLDGATAGWEAARRNYNNSFLVSPADGVIAKLMALEGQYITYGSQIAYIANNSSLVIKTGVGESQISKLKQGQSAEISVNGAAQSTRGIISGVGLRPLPGAANYSLEIRILDSRGLQPGMVATARILSGTVKNQLFTSINNIFKEYDRYYVYTVNNANQAVRKEIKTGKVIGENVVILSGLSAGEKIVTTGAENLEDGISVEIRR